VSWSSGERKKVLALATKLVKALVKVTDQKTVQTVLSKVHLVSPLFDIFSSFFH